MDLHYIDWIIVIVYGLIIVGVGLWFSKKAGEGLEEYFAENSKNKLLQTILLEPTVHSCNNAKLYERDDYHAKRVFARTQKGRTVFIDMVYEFEVLGAKIINCNAKQI